MGRKVTNITPMTQTKAAVFSQPSERWTSDWDKDVGFEQAMRRSQRRERMGIKETPKGPGKLIKG